MGTTGVRKRSEIAMCSEGCCDDSEGRCICTDAISDVGEVTSFVCILERSPCGHLVCAFMEADTSCEMFARPPKGQETKGGSGDCLERWIPGWCTHGIHGFTRGNWNDVLVCTSQTRYDLCLVSTTRLLAHSL